MHKQSRVRNARQTAGKLWSEPKVFGYTKYIRLVKSFCKEANTPFSLALFILLDASILDAIMFTKTLDPNHYGKDSATYSKDAQCAALIKKYKGHTVDIDVRSECAKSFIQAEVVCRETNERFRDKTFYSRNDSNAAIFLRAQSIIARILGDVNNVDLSTVQFSKGRTFSIKENTLAFDKLSGPLEVTRKARRLAKNTILANPGWLSGFCQSDHALINNIPIVESLGDLYSSVPKDATTDRPLGMPPLLNAVMSKSVGKHISRRFKTTTGININTAQRKHRDVVRDASVHGNISSVDLSSASDTIAWHLVLDLLPLEWFDLLNDLRSPAFFVKESDRWFSYEKFTAMGCAFTFELESVIFYSLVKASMEVSGCDGFLSVYGDDILLPTDAYNASTFFLEECGFSINHTKSFSTGYFRESCGADYLDGNEVRPFFLKDVLTPRVAVLMHNSLIRSGTRNQFPRSFSLLRKMIPRCFYETISGPMAATGDDYLIDEELSLNTPKRVIQTIMRTREILVDDPMLLPYMLYRIEQSRHGPLVPGLKDVLDCTLPLKLNSDKTAYKLSGTCPESANSGYVGDDNSSPQQSHYFRVSRLQTVL